MDFIVKKFNEFTNVNEGKYQDIDNVKKFILAQNDISADKIEWLVSELCNDEESTDDELVLHFVKEGGLTVEEAKEWVAKRSVFFQYPMECGEIIETLVESVASPLQKEYRELFTFLLNKFGVKSPRSFGKEKEKADKFYTEIEKSWVKGKGLSAYGKKMMEEKPKKVDESAVEEIFKSMKEEDVNIIREYFSNFYKIK